MEARRQAEKPLARKHRKGVPRVFGRSGPVGRSGAYVVHVARCLFQCLSRSSVWPAVLLSLAAAAEWLPSPWDCATLCVSPVSSHLTGGSPGPPSHPPALPSPSVNNTPRAHTPPSTLTTPGVASSRLPPRVPSYTFGFGRLSRRRASGIGRRESPAWLLSLSVSFACSLSLSLSSARLFPFLYLSLLYVVDRFI